jgi:hypothetical protein
MGYNNDRTTTFADIQKVFAALEARIRHRLDTEPSAPSAAAPNRSRSCACRSNRHHQTRP